MIREAVRALSIARDGSFCWFGDLSMPGPEAARGRVEEMRGRLERTLYWNFFVVGKATPIVGREDDEDADENAFVEELSAANCGRGSIERGWRIVGRHGGSLQVRRDGLTLSVTPDRAAGSRGTVALRGLNELRGLSPGFYVALGDRALPQDPLMRVYWNVAPEAAAAFIRHTTRILNRAGLPFQAKVVSNPLAFDRCDSAVVYLPRRDRRRAYPHLNALYRSMKRRLRDPTPAMTKRVARGVGIAEDPAGDLSFGEHRCRAIAKALLRAHAKHLGTDDARVAEILAAFARDGIAPARPYLDARSHDRYGLLEA